MKWYRNGQRFNSNNRGVTLIELMIATALFGVTSLLLMTLMAEYTKSTVKAKNDIDLTADVFEFSDSLQHYLSATTAVLGCGCGSGCVFPQNPTFPPGGLLSDCAVAGSTCLSIPAGNIPGVPIAAPPINPAPATAVINLLFWEAETSPIPAERIAPNNNNTTCVGPATGITPGGFNLRGCKKRLLLRYFPPPTYAGVAAAIEAPGYAELLILNDSSANSVGTAQWSTIARLKGTYSLFCGFDGIEGVPNGITNREKFRLQARTKSASSTMVATGATPPAWSVAHPNFLQATHRLVDLGAEFHNLTARGIHFGHSTTQRNCIPDLQAIAAGQTADACCSGYSDGFRCLSECSGAGCGAGCLVAGTNSLNAPNPGDDCCSHQASNGVCQ